MDVIEVMSCQLCRTFWRVGQEPECADARHEHRAHSLHRHRDRVAVTDGLTVTAVSFDATDPYGRSDPPGFGCYLDERWAPSWPHRQVAWPDFGVPDAADLAAALREVATRARRGESVEIGCLGGHGRTGTALACLAVLAGTPVGSRSTGSGTTTATVRSRRRSRRRLSSGSSTWWR